MARNEIAALVAREPEIVSSDQLATIVAYHAVGAVLRPGDSAPLPIGELMELIADKIAGHVNGAAAPHAYGDAERAALAEAQFLFVAFASKAREYGR